MTALRIKDFRGKVPRRSERLLPGNYAEEALNCKLSSGRLDPIRGLSLVHTSLAAAVGTMFRYRHAGADNWLVWERQVDAVRSPTAQDSLGRLYYTGDGEPRMSSFADAISGGGPYPAGWFVLGVYIPTVAPTGGTTGGAAADETRAYVYTFKTQYAEESAPSPAVLITGPSDATSWDLSAMEAPPPNSGTVTGAATLAPGVVEVELDTVRGLALDEEITFAGVGGMTDLNATFPITAIDTGTNKVRIALDTAQTYTSGGTWARRAPHNTTGMKRCIYRTVGTNTDYKLVAEIDAATTTYADSVAPTALGSSIQTLTSYTPPKNGHSLVALANGALAMLAGNELCISEQYKPYSWPLANRYAFAGLGVALAAAANAIIVVTDGFPVLATATVPEATSLAKMEGVFAPGLSKAGVVDTGGGCLSPSHDGLWFLSPAGGKKVTENTYRLEEWQAIKPESFRAAYHDGCYYAMREATDEEQQGRIWILDLSAPDSVVEVDEEVDAMYANPLDGKLYMAQGNKVYQWDAADASRYLAFWQSAEFQVGPPVNFKCAQVHARYSEIVPLDTSVQEANAVLLADADNIEHAMGISEIGVYPIGATNLLSSPSAIQNRVQFSLVRDGTIVFTKELDSSDPFQLPSGFKDEIYSVQIGASIPVFSVGVAQSMAELAQVSE